MSGNFTKALNSFFLAYKTLDLRFSHPTPNGSLTFYDEEKMKFRHAVTLGLACLFSLNSEAKGGSSEVPTVPHVDLQKYLGKWYEVASIPQWFQKQCVANTTAEYSAADDNLIKVINSCDTESGERDSAEGRARVEDTSSNSKLKVTFVKIIDWVFLFGGNYWIVDLKPDYSYALIGDPSREYAWILSRTPNLPLSEMLKAEQKFRSLGYDTCAILTSVQNGGAKKRVPLCKLTKLSE